MYKAKDFSLSFSIVLAIVSFVFFMWLVPNQILAANNNYQTEPILRNGNFERNIEKNDIQTFKGQRINKRQGKVYNGNYALQIGKNSPGKDSKDYPRWLYNEGKGSANLVIRNVQPNTKYKISMNYFNQTGVKFRLGVLDTEGKKDWKPGQINSNYKTFDKKTSQWQAASFEITTGPRTKEIDAFALTEWTGNEKGSGLFYLDNVKVNKIGQQVADKQKTIEYDPDKVTAFPTIIPAVKQFEGRGNSKFHLDKNLQRIFVPRNMYSQGKLLGEKLKKAGIIRNYIVSTNLRLARKGIVISNSEVDFRKDLNAIEKQNAYQFDITPQTLIIRSKTNEGIQNGIMTALQAFRQRNALPTGKIKDYSDQEYRGLQVDSGRRYYSIDWLKEAVDQMAELKLNKLQLRLKDNEGIRYQSDVAPQFSDTDGRAWSKNDIRSLVNYARKYNIEVIPEIDFPGHSEQDGVYFDKSWLLSSKSNALDISNPEVRKYMANVYQEAFKLFDSKTVHIGGDEYFQTSGFADPDNKLAKWAQRQTKNPHATKYDAFKLFINEIAKPYLNQGKQVFVWNDNILDLNSTVKLDPRLVVDVWAGTIYDSITASNAVDNGYEVAGSASDLYHDLWPDNDKIDRPLPKFLYEKWQSNSYSKGFDPHENLSATQMQKSKGQFFPIWDDANGYAPEYVLSKTLYSRLPLFANNMWGSQEWVDRKDKPRYEEMERLIHYMEPESAKSVEYTNTDVNYIANTIKGKLRGMKTRSPIVKRKIIKLRIYVGKVLRHTQKADNNTKIYKMIHDFENLSN